MGRISDHIATMRGSSLAQIVAEIARLEDEAGPKVPPGFDEFWATYPRKTAKPAALKAYRAAMKRKVPHETIMMGLQFFIASEPDPQYTPHPSTWLNQDRFNDRPLPRKLGGRAASNIDLLEQDLAERINNGNRGQGSAYPSSVPLISGR